MLSVTLYHADDKFLALPKLKAIADENFNVGQISNFCERV